MIVLIGFLLALVPTWFSIAAKAETMGNIYEEIAQKYPNDIKTMKKYGASEGEIKSFVDALGKTLEEDGSLTEENINEAVAEAVLDLFFEGDHNSVFDAIFNGWNLNADVLLDAYTNGGTAQVTALLPASFLEIGSLVKDKILESQEENDDNQTGNGSVENNNGNEESDEEKTGSGSVIVIPSIPVDNVKTFDDVKKHWAKSDIEFIISKGIANGVSETQFQPNRSITRAEFAAMLINMLKIDTNGAVGFHFSDVPYQAWYAKIVYTAVDANLVKGVSPTSFAPKQNITRQEMAAMVTNALAYKKMSTTVSQEELNNLKKYHDNSELSSWAEKSVAVAMKNGIITGRSANTLAPRANATRAEAAVMMKRLYLLID